MAAASKASILGEGGMEDTGQVHSTATGLAARTVQLIEQHLFTEMIPAGSAVASEKELAARFGVGRHTMREAIRILQFRGWIRMRKGPHGGLIVMQPSLHKIVGGLVGRFLAEGVTERDIRRARLIVALAATKLALRRRQEIGTEWQTASDDCSYGPEEFRNFAARSRFSVLLAWVGGNAALTLFAYALAVMVEQQFQIHLRPEDPTEQDWRKSCERAIAAAIQCGDGDAACRLLRTYHDRVDGAFHIFTAPPPGAAPNEPGLSMHRATSLARQIVVSIVVNHSPAGTYLGSKESLGVQHAAPDATLLQALRILEADGIVELRRGRGLGVFVGRPNREAPLAMLRYYLRAQGFDGSTAQELVRSLCIELCLDAPSEAGKAVTGKVAAFFLTAPADRSAIENMNAWFCETVADDPILGILARTLCDWPETTGDGIKQGPLSPQ